MCIVYMHIKEVLERIRNVTARILYVNMHLQSYKHTVIDEYYLSMR